MRWEHAHGSLVLRLSVVFLSHQIFRFWAQSPKWPHYTLPSQDPRGFFLAQRLKFLLATLIYTVFHRFVQNFLGPYHISFLRDLRHTRWNILVSCFYVWGDKYLWKSLGSAGSRTFYELSKVNMKCIIPWIKFMTSLVSESIKNSYFDFIRLCPFFAAQLGREIRLWPEWLWFRHRPFHNHTKLNIL